MPQVGDVLNYAPGTGELTGDGLGARLNQRIVTAVKVATEYRTRILSPARPVNMLVYPHPPYAPDGTRQTRYPVPGLSAPPRLVHTSGRLGYQNGVAASKINRTQALGALGLRAPRRNEATDNFACQDIGTRHQIDDVLRWGF